MNPNTTKLIEEKIEEFRAKFVVIDHRYLGISHIRSTITPEQMAGYLRESLEAVAQEARNESNDLLLSAYSIAERRGKDTNWDAWIKKHKNYLDEQLKESTQKEEE